MKSTFTRRKGKKDAGATTADAQQKPEPRARGAKRDGAAAAGLPPFLRQAVEPPLVSRKVRATPKLKPDTTTEARESEAERASEHVRHEREGSGPGVAQKVNRVSDGEALVGGLVGRQLGASKSGGEPLPAATRELLEEKFGGADFGGVRVHTDEQAARTAESFHANAFTSGEDIYFNRGVYEPATVEGRALLAHELTHVVQQKGGGSGLVQFDLRETRPLTLGDFYIDMTARTVPDVGMEGTIKFMPDPSGPYSAQIGLIQLNRIIDVAGRRSVAGTPMNWNNALQGAEAGRMDLATTGTDGAPPGWMVDSLTSKNPRGSSIGPNYIEHAGILPPDNAFGWLRSPTDFHEASLWDYPFFTFDVDFAFETVAKATDTQTVYGALHWGFSIRSGAVDNEYVYAVDAQSAIFDEALERYRGYYTHEPIVIYFDTDADAPTPGEVAKISGVLDYLSRYPDVHVRIDGFADRRGNEAYNLDLSRRRAQNVRAEAIALGISASKIYPINVRRETDAFAAGADEGSWRANRRVVMSFVRTATSPIVMP